MENPMRTRISAQLIGAMAVVTILGIVLIAAAILPTHRAALVAQMTRNAAQLSETIKNGVHESMLENRRDRLQREIQTIGAQPEIRRLRLLDRDGIVRFSTHDPEVGRPIDAAAESCPGCPAPGRRAEDILGAEPSRLFTGPEGGRILGTIHPIRNTPTCSAAGCHAHPPTDSVLGFLDVTMPLDDVDRAIARTQARLAGLAALALFLSGAMLWWLNRRLVVRPVEALAAGTRRVAEGDLTTSIPVTSSTELGDLARDFNTMVRRLSEAQRQLAQADKLASLGRLAAGVAHEINNPLTGVLTYTSLLLKRADNDPAVRADLEVVLRETKRCRDIVRGLLDFARQTPPHRQATDLNEVVRRSVAVVMNQLAVNRIAVSLDLAPDLPDVLADGNQMQQVTVNLVLNAADAVGEEGGTIRIRTRRDAIPAWGHAIIRRAVCPRGCDLIDRETRIGGLPAILLVRQCGGRETLVRADPVYGRANHRTLDPCDEGLMAEFLCPRCRAALRVPEGRCATCQAPTFAVQVPGDGQVEWCARNGCRWARWESAEAGGPTPVIELEVEDSGRGIPPDVLSHLFEPFFTTKGSRGTGLGLAVSWGIIERHGGTIEARSEAGRGTVFTVRLPLRPDEPVRAAAA
jgi:two-component system NtrC family sensor kinase